MRTITAQVFKYSELSDDAKEHAIEACRDINTRHEWWDYIVDDAKTIAELGGIDIDNVYFSGFSSQGDGACYTGSYAYKKGALKAIKEYAPEDTELHDIFQTLQNIQRRNFYGLTATMSHRGHYNHSGCMEVCTPWEVYVETHEELRDTLRLFADWIYCNLEREYWYLVGDDAIKESIEANEMEFTSEGSLA